MEYRIKHSTMKRLITILLLLFAFGSTNAQRASWWYGNAPGEAAAGPDTLTLTYWNDFILLHIANTGITETGSGVSEWQDRSGNGNHSTQTVDTNRPTVDGSGNVVFDGVDNFLLGVNLWASRNDSSLTVFVIAEAQSIGVRNKILEQNNFTGATDFLFRIQYDSIAGTSNIELQTLVDDDGINNFDNVDTIAINTPFLCVVAASETTTTETRVNGVQVYSVANNGSWDTPFESSSNEVLMIGTNANNSTQFANVKIKFIGIANRKFTPAEIATTESELNSFFTIY